MNVFVDTITLVKVENYRREKARNEACISAGGEGLELRKRMLAFEAGELAEHFERVVCHAEKEQVKNGE